MEITRVNEYNDERFSKEVLREHGAFLIDNVDPYEVKILNHKCAVIKGKDENKYLGIIEEFRFYAGFISEFYNEAGKLLKKYDETKIFKIGIEDIEPSQFYVDLSKMEKVSEFIKNETDVIIPVYKNNAKFISLDGHTRLKVAINKGFKEVYAYFDDAFSSIFDFVSEAKKRNILSPYDLIELSHEDYCEKWHKYCDDYFANKKDDEFL